MASEKFVTHDCLSIKITTATFAQPRSYFLTAQCIHKDSNIDDSINESKPKYRTAASKSTKTPQFNSKKPFLIKLPNDIKLDEALEEYKIVFEAYAVVSLEENSINKEAKLMGESILILFDKKQQLLNQESIEDVITLEGVLKIEQTEKRVPVGQASITLQLQQITESILNRSTSHSSITSRKAVDQISIISANKDKEKQKSKSLTPSSLHTYTVKTPPLVSWPAIKHANCIMIQINRWWGNNIDLWPESFIHIMHRTCGEVVTATHCKSESLNFYEILELPLDMNQIEMNEVSDYAPFIFKLMDESSRQVIESFALPSTCLSVLHQYDFLLSFGEQSKINLECCIWFNPNRSSMINILQQKESMILTQITLDEMRGFEEKCRYSCFVEIMDIKESISKMHSNKIKIDFNKAPFDWSNINHSCMTQKRYWLHFYSNQCIDLQSLYLFCCNDVISGNHHQIVIKIYKDSPNDYSHSSLIGFMTIPIESDSNCSQQQYNIKLLDPKTKSVINDKEIDISVQLFNHQNALQFMRYPTPKNEESNSNEYEISISTDSRIRLIEDAKTYKDVINSELFQSIRSQLTHHPPRISSMNIKEEEKQERVQEIIMIKKPTQRLFEAIERELTTKQSKIETLELEREEKMEEFKIIANEMNRLREESITIKRLNQRLAMRLEEVMKNNSKSFKNIDILSADKLKSMVIKYANGHKTEKHRRRHLEHTLSKLISKLKAAKQIHTKLVKIQSAAQEQAEYIRKLQKRQNDMDEYKETIISQEQVIEKLEEMLSWAHGTIKSLQQKLESGNVVSNRERELENEIIALQQENEELRKQIQMAKQDKLHEIVEDVDKLKDDLRQANYRNDGLQTQLEVGAGQFGAQIADLKLQLRKLQDGEDQDDEDLFSNLSDGTAAELSQLSDMLDSVSIATRDSDD